MNGQISENIKILKEKISNYAAEAGKEADNINLIAVSKTKPLDLIIAAHNAGIEYFGENKVQELRQKMEEGNPSILWHYIGHLQTNKVKYIVDKVNLIHSVDSLKLAEKISKLSMTKDKKTSILLQVNTSGEQSKFGFSADELMENLEILAAYKDIHVRGLMTMAPFTNDVNQIANSFSKLRLLSENIKKQMINNVEMQFLSMGMSNDYEIAIKEGSNMLRIGTLIFGARN